MNIAKAGRAGLTGLLAAALVLSAGGGSSQPAAVPQFPPGPDFAGVAGSAREHARITALCGPNRNARDGYSTTPAFPGQTRAPIVTAGQGHAVQSIAKIDRPFGMDLLPNGKMLVSFRNGGMRIVTPAGVVSEPLANVPQVVQPRLGSGMYDVAVDRDFRRNRTIYFTYHTRLPQDRTAMGRVARARLSADERSLEDVRTLREAADIQPRRIVQARDGTLLIMSAGNLADVGPAPQTLSSQAGKVLRINTDGTIPADNPFRADPKADPAVWALGFRDIHAALIHPRTGELWAAENTPMGGDELNVVRRGRNYGMPVISYGRQNSGALINGGKTAQAGMEQPLYYWTPSFAPSGIMLYTGKAFPRWRNNLFIGGMSGEQLVRLEMRGERVVAEEKLLMDRCQRIKVVKQAPDGSIYILTDEMPPEQNEILRLVPARTAPAPRVARAAAPSPVAAAPAGDLGDAVYRRTCAACHGPQGAGGPAPRIAGRTDAQAVAAVVRNGQGAMPPLGAILSAAEVEAVARHVGRLSP
ncbi:PQQ-dependent sugar dehydrogenase [Phenylobacterium sp.]|jgi:glucose/arabinose dehydrogenase|uniref:PQQ-dependent sugar dehydrogenase n=1 Tax=Phenylobacterium sp. TaxID=1871053 RepID=UPI002F92FA55